jgi:hypothetical protein
VSGDILAKLVQELTGSSPVELVTELGDEKAAAVTLVNLIHQAPLDFDRRRRLLHEFSAAEERLIAERPGELVGVAAYLHHAPIRIPVVAEEPVVLPPLDDELEAAYRMLLQLDEQVSEPWTLIGGLMVFTLCAEHGAPFTRPTGDADIAVGVFTHRAGLARVTSHLMTAGFEDITPSAIDRREQLSYRWAREGVKFDVAVPPKVNGQRNRPTSATGRTATELPATQQALQRTERLAVRIGNDTGYVRRPDLLAAIIIKAVAARTDIRNPERHREDLVSLADNLAHSGEHLRFAPQMRPKDRSRLATAVPLITRQEWRGARDPQAAQAAFTYLLNHST